LRPRDTTRLINYERGSTDKIRLYPLRASSHSSSKKTDLRLSTYKAKSVSHAARLELIKSVFSSIPIYYMSNIIFSKKFHAKITSIIRNFWWTGINSDPEHKPLCLAAWKNICAPIKEGGLGIRNLNAVNHALILTSIWRIAEHPHSQI
jgi:hypothetical protein